MTRFIKLIPVFLLTLLLITCSKDNGLNDTIGPNELISSSDGTEANEVYGPVEPIGLDFDALIREVEAEVGYLDSDEYGAKSAEKIAKEAELKKQTETIRQSIISIIDARARRGHLYADWSIFKAPYNNYYEKSRYNTPVIFNSKSKRDWNVDFAISVITGWLANLYELEFLEVKLKQLWWIHRDDGNYNCEDLAIIKKIKRRSKWKGYGGNIGYGIINPYGDKKIKHKGELLDLRSAKLKLFATKYVKILIDRATPPNLTRDVLRQTFYDANKKRVPTDAELLKWKLTWKLGWWTWYNTDGTIRKTFDGKRKMVWYNGLNYNGFTRTEEWKEWTTNCTLKSNGRTIQHAIPYCAEPYYKSVETIRNKIIQQVKELEILYPERISDCNELT